MTIGVTGSNGFIGRAFVSYLKEHSIDCLKLEPSTLDKAYDQRITHIVHLAGKTSVRNSWEQIPLFLESNVIFLAKILELAVKIEAPVTLFSTYGYAPSNETSGLSPYHLTKEFTEKIAGLYNQKFKVPVAILRLASVYGVGQHKNGLIPNIITQILDPMIQAIVVDSLAPLRSYIDVRDVAAYIYASILTPQAFKISYVGGMCLVSVEDVINEVSWVTGIRKPYRQILDDVDDPFLVNIQKNFSDPALGSEWRPRHSLREGLSYLIESMQA